jgi:hypothetical protein
MALFVVCVSTRSQLTLETGETFGYFTNWSGVPAGFSGTPSPAGTTCMKLSAGFSKSTPSVLMWLFYGVCFYFLLSFGRIVNRKRPQSFLNL